MRVLSWNVAGRVRLVPDQLALVVGEAADVVVLQEVRATTGAQWSAGLADAGYASVHTSLPAGAPAADPARRLGVLVASRAPAAAVPDPPPLPWPERYLAVDVAGVVVHAVHVPTSARSDRVKVRTIEALVPWLAIGGTGPAIVAGELNTPQYESREGEVRSFARTRTGRLRAGYDERHDAAERALVPGLAVHGFVDAFRAVNGYEARDRSWMYAGRAFGYRLDHVFVRGLEPRACAYLHGWREAGLSDHSALWAELRVPGAAS